MRARTHRNGGENWKQEGEKAPPRGCRGRSAEDAPASPLSGQVTSCRGRRFAQAHPLRCAAI
ncbi:hypothetical protein OKW35_002256 [Paraburkholderia sp. MM5477-R1]